MHEIILATKRPYDWRVFWVLVGLSIPAAFAILPFAMNLQAAYRPDIAQDASPLIFDAIVNITLVAFLGGLGLALANRVGLGLPFVEGWVRRDPIHRRFTGVVAWGLLFGIGCGLVILLLDLQVFRQPMLGMFQELGIETPKESAAPPHYGFMAAISAGIIEEILFRLFGLSLLVWLGGFLIHNVEGRPKPVVFWVANIVFALIFGAAHLITAKAIGWPMNALVLTRTFVLNGVAGIAFGWLFWSYGLESAMFAHFFTDVVLYTLLPIILLQEKGTATVLASAGIIILVLLGVIWAIRAVVRERNKH